MRQVVLLVLLLVHSSVFASNQSAKIMIHVRPVTGPGNCGQGFRACGDMIVAGQLFPDTYYAYLCVVDADPVVGVSRLKFGITYNGASRQGVDIFSWSHCGTLENPTLGWPANGSGNEVTWVGCARSEPAGSGTGVVACAGYFYIAAYTPDLIGVTQNPNTIPEPIASVIDCDQSEVVIEGPGAPFQNHLGHVTLSVNGQEPGYNPCGLDTPVEAVTWGRLKMGRLKQ